MKKINNFIKNNIQNIILIFLYIQPFLDVLTAISIKKFNIDLTIGSIIRLVFLIFCIYYLIIINKKEKKKNIIYLTILGIYFLLFTLNILLYKDIHALSYEIKNTLNTFYLPITLISFIEIFKQFNIKFSLKHIVIIFSIYLIFIIIPAITHTSFLSYSHSKLGTIGWFLSANAIGNILSFLLPIVIYYLVNISKNNLIKIIIAISTLYVFSNMGTKVPILSLIIILATSSIYYLIKCFKNKYWQKLRLCFGIIITIIIVSLIIIPKTTFYKNIQIHMSFYNINNYKEIFTNYDNINNLIFSERLTFLKNTNSSYKKAHNLEKIFGIGYIENYNTSKMSTKTIEIDYFEIFYRHGIIGFILYFIVFIKILIMVIKRTFKEFNFLNIQYFTSLILILLLALFSGHILVTPAVSIYISLLFTIILVGFKEKKKID
jgi:hypothetical protein